MKSLLQTQEWADFKVQQGWKSHEIDGIFILEKRLPMRMSFLYAPEVTWATLDTKYKNFYENIKNIAKNSNSIFLRLEILNEKNDTIIQNLKNKGFIKAFEEVQPEWRQIIDISKSEDEILTQMKPKGRYNIKVAQKHNVQTKVYDSNQIDEAVKIFYPLYQHSSQYQKIAVREKHYFKQLLEALSSKNEIAVIVVKYNHKPLAAIIITFYQGLASYLYGGTSREDRNVMAPYAAHWQAIQLAKQRGCQQYDLLAIAPPDQVDHKYANLTRFKEQFGGRKINLVGSWDLVFRPFWYQVFKILEKMRR